MHPRISIISSGTFYLHGLALIPAWISNHTIYKIWGEVTCLSNFNVGNNVIKKGKGNCNEECYSTSATNTYLWHNMCTPVLRQSNKNIKQLHWNHPVEPFHVFSQLVSSQVTWNRADFGVVLYRKRYMILLPYTTTTGRFQSKILSLFNTRVMNKLFQSPWFHQLCNAVEETDRKYGCWWITWKLRA